jgi:hypothetical protein
MGKTWSPTHWDVADTCVMTNLLWAILSGGGLCALLDGICVTLLYGAKGAKPIRVWQGVATSVLGPQAFRAGWSAGILGIGLHCLVALSAASAFVLVSRHAGILLRQSVLSGIFFGMLVFVVMNLVVVRLSAMPKQPLNISVLTVQFAMHIFLVGLPISLLAKYFSQ